MFHVTIVVVDQELSVGNFAQGTLSPALFGSPRVRLTSLTTLALCV